MLGEIQQKMLTSVSDDQIEQGLRQMQNKGPY